MRRDLVTQVIVEWADGEVDNFATPFEAERYINAMLDELDDADARLVGGHGRQQEVGYDIVEDDDGVIRLID